MTRTEEIRARVEKATPDWELSRQQDGILYIVAQSVAVGQFYGTGQQDTWNAEFATEARQDVPYLLTELTALREEVARLKGALRVATHCPTCDGTGKMTLECMACLSGEPGGRCICAEETCVQCDGRGWATADGTGEELVAAALSPSPAQQEEK